MTFAELFTQISQNVWPEGEARNLRTLHKNLVRSALIDLQKKVECLQSQNVEYIEHEDTFFFCGTSAFTAPTGFIQSLRTIPDLLETMDWRQCDTVWAQPETREEFECRIQTRAECYPASSSSNVALCGCPCPIDMPYGYYTYGEYDYYRPYPDLPFGLMYSDSTTDRTCRARTRFFAMYNGYIYTYPVINSDELIILEWHGIKKNWADSDIFPYLDEDGEPDRQVIEAVEYYVMSENAMRIDCDKDKMLITKSRYDQLVSELIWQCRKSKRIPYRKHCFPPEPVVCATPCSASSDSTESTTEEEEEPEPEPEPLDEDVEIFINRLGGAGCTLPEAQETALNTLVVALKAAGIWDKASVIYPYVCGTAAGHSLNLKNNIQYDIVWSGGMTHNANGITGDGATGYGDTGWNPNIDSTFPSNIWGGCYVRTEFEDAVSGVGHTDFGVTTVAGARRFQLDANFYQFIEAVNRSHGVFSIGESGGTAWYKTGVDLDFSTGFWSGGDVPGLGVTIYRRGDATLGTRAGTAGSLVPSSQVFVCASNNSGVAGTFSPRNLAFHIFGAVQMSNAEHVALASIVEAFQVEMGRSVV